MSDDEISAEETAAEPKESGEKPTNKFYKQIHVAENLCAHNPEEVATALEHHQYWLHTILSPKIEEPGAGRANFTGADLRGRDFGGTNLSGATFAQAHLENAAFQGAKLVAADFSGANLRNANFTRAELRKANFQGALLEGADFTDADLRHSTLEPRSGATREQEIS